MPHNGNRGQINLSSIQSALDYAFINHLKTCQQWDYSDSSGRPDVAFMNAQGFPKNLNSKTWRTIFNKPISPDYTGNWIVDWVGEATVGLSGSSTVSGSTSGVNGRWVVSNTSATPTFSISAINAANPPTQIRIYRADHEDLLLAGEIFTPLFLEKMGKCGVIRPDTVQSNISNVALWRDRTPVDYFSYGCSHWDITRDAGTTTNIADAYSCTPPVGYVRSDKCKLHVKLNFTNTTTTPTFDDGFGAKLIKDPRCDAMTVGGLVINRRDTFTFDEGLDCWLSTRHGTSNEFDEGINGGMPPEVAIALCNKVNAHYHVNMPHLACDTLTGITDYATELATYAEANFNSGLKLRAQIGNELFNTSNGFFAGKYATAKGLDRWGAVGSNDANYNWHGRSLSLVGGAFAAVYNDTSKYDILASVQSAGTPDISAVRSTILESPRHVSDGGTIASSHVTVICIANYWASRLRYPSTSTPNEAGFHFFIADAFEWATASAARQLELTEAFYGGAQAFIDGSGQDRMETWWNCAQFYLKRLACYEGANSEDHITANPRCRVLGISKAVNAVVTMPSGHGFRTGMQAGPFKLIEGMTEINHDTNTHEVLAYDDTTFTIALDTTTFSTFTNGTGTADYATNDPTLRGVGFSGDGVTLGRDMCNDYLDAVRDSPITYLYAMKNLLQHISLADTEFPSHYVFSGLGVWTGHPGNIYTYNSSWLAFEHFSTNKVRMNLQCVV